MLLRLLSAQVVLPALLSAAALAGPMVCTTSLEAPDASAPDGAAPVALTTCAAVETTSERIERVAYSWTSPYATGVNLVHQVTDLFGIALGGIDGNRVMGFGFADQTIIWDGTAIENTTRALLEEQNPPMPTRTRDLSNGFGSSLALELSGAGSLDAQGAQLPLDKPVTPAATPVQPLW